MSGSYQGTRRVRGVEVFGDWGGVPLGRKAGGPLGSDNGGARVSSWGSAEDLRVPNRLPGPSDIRIQQGFFRVVENNTRLSPWR